MSIYNNLRMYLSLIKHYGGKYECPICGYKSDSMLPFGETNEAVEKYNIVGAGYRNVKCRRCGSHDRERLIYLYLRDIACIFKTKDMNILHVAPEIALSKSLLKGPFNYVCGDLFMDGYSYPPYVKNMDLLNLPINDSEFDIVLCNHVLEHIKDDKKAMSEIYRILKPNGVAIIQVPISFDLSATIEETKINTPEERDRLFGQRDHCRLYGNDYPKRLSECGFYVETMSLSNKYPKYCLNPNEKLFICRKKCAKISSL